MTAIHISFHVDEATPIARRSLAGFPGQDCLAIGHELTIHFGHDAAEIVGNADRLTAAIAEIRAAAVDHLRDGRAAALADGDHFAGMPA